MDEIRLMAERVGTSATVYRVVGVVCGLVVLGGSYLMSQEMAETCVGPVCVSDSGAAVAWWIGLSFIGFLILIPVFSVARVLDGVSYMLHIEALTYPRGPKSPSQ